MLLSFTDLLLLTFHNNIVKISEILNEQNLLKTLLQFIYPIDLLCNLQPILQIEIKKLDFLKQKNIIKFWDMGRYQNIIHYFKTKICEITS